MSKFNLAPAQDKLNELKYGKEAWTLIKELRQECEDRAETESSLFDWNGKLYAQVEELEKEVNAARNLLAFIHRDGGHHREKFELDSYKIAENIVVVHRHTLEQIADGEHPDEAPDLAEEALEKF